jgi:peptidyl-prolyl cis-trans isomerase SurA
MQTRLASAPLGRVLGAGATALLLFIGSASAQMQTPRYQSPLAAPQPQFTIPLPPAITPNGTVVEDVIARVNDQIIDRSDYERAQQQLLADAQQRNMSPADVEQAQKDLLRNLIDVQLLLSRGKELDINVDSEVIRELDEIRKQYNFDSMEALEKAVRDQGISFEDFKASKKNDIITQEVVSQEVGRKLTLTGKEEQAYYDQHKQDFAQPEQVGLSEILIPLSASPTDAQIAQAQSEADEVVAKLKAGAKFEDLVKQYSGGPNSDAGGFLGEFKQGALPQVFEDQTFKLPVGGNTTPIRTREGFVVLKVTDHQAAGIPPLSAIDQQVKEAIYRDAIQPAVRTYLAGLRDRASIDIQQGFVDTGATPDELKGFSYAAYAPPVAKAKKIEEKKRIDRTPTTGPAAAKPGVAGAAKPAAASNTPAAAPPPGNPSSAKTVAVASSGKPKKPRREKIRYGQAPQNSLPSGPEQALAAGGDQGPGPASTLAAPGTAVAPVEQSNIASDADPLAPKVVQGKTRFSDRVEEPKLKPIAMMKAEAKAAAAPAPLSADEKAKQQLQDAPLGLNGDTATKKKKVKDKNAPKERIEDKPPAPPAAPPEATPIPPKSVRDNGEPVVAPPPDPSTLPPVTVPGSGAAPATTAPAAPPQ